MARGRKINWFVRDRNLRRVSDYVTKATRFLETGLFVSVIINGIFIHLWFLNSWMDIFPRAIRSMTDLLILAFAYGMLWVGLGIPLLYLSFHRVASDSGVGLMGSRGLYSMDTHSVSKEKVKMEDEWKVGARSFKRTKIMRFGNLNGVEKWFGYDGGGRDGCYSALQGSVLCEWVNARWVPIEAFSVQDGLILKQGIRVGDIIETILKSKDLKGDAERITKMLQGMDVGMNGQLTEADLINRIKEGAPYKELAAHFKYFPQHFVPRWFEESPKEIQETICPKGRTAMLKHFTVNAPILMGEDIAVEAGGVGSPLQSHQLTRYLSQERIIAEQERTIYKQRVYITMLESAHLNKALLNNPEFADRRKELGLEK